jgi:tetratricopeptide (TPR) repeat protein
VAVLALLVSLSIAPAADVRMQSMLRDWIAAVDTHTAGERDAAFTQVTAWTANDLALLRIYVEVLAGVPMNRERRDRQAALDDSDLTAIRAHMARLQARGDFVRFRIRAAILHTDIALMASPPAIIETPSPVRHRGAATPRVDVLSTDGRVDRYEQANPHWEFSMSLLESLPAAPQRPAVVGQWYGAIGALFAVERRYADAMEHFSRAREVVPDDPAVLYGDAVLQETLASPRIQDYVKVTSLPNGLVIRGVSSRDTHLRRAEAMLRKAIAAQPRFPQAHLRLGRVLTQLRRPAESLPVLGTAIEQSNDRVVSYFAHLFSGDALLALHRLEDSRASYERAVDLFPKAQAARLGLAAALRTAGDRPAALQAMLPFLSKSPAANSGDDPWWDYYFGYAADVERSLDDMREPFRHRTPQ